MTVSDARQQALREQMYSLSFEERLYVERVLDVIDFEGDVEGLDEGAIWDIVMESGFGDEEPTQEEV